MFSKKPFIIFSILFIIFFSACSSLPSFGNKNNPAEFPLGPQISQTEHQIDVFEHIMSRVQESYIYYEDGQYNWDALNTKYINQIEKGISTAEFNELMTEFENEFGADEVIYITREERIEIDTTVQTTQFVGIGAFVSYQAEDIPHVAILDVMPNSPAEKAGIRAHDSIYAVDGKPVTAEEGADVIQRVRGEAGTTVVLTIQTPGQSKRDVEIVRAQVNGIGKLKSQTLSENRIGYILMPTFVSEKITDDVIDTLSKFSDSGEMKGLILDLRIANGESNWPLEEMVTLFLDGEVGTAYNRTESDKIKVSGQDFFNSQNIPLVVLVGEHTIGSAEIFAAFVESSGRGIVIGSNTSGNIETQIGFQLPDGGQIFIAYTSIRPKGNQMIGIDGFSPNVQNEAQWDEINPAQDPLIEQAIQSFEVTE